MAKRKVTTYGVLVFVAYGFFILLGLAWFFLSLRNNWYFNYIAFVIVAVFAVQAYYHHRLTNLILGILGLFFSIVMFLEVLTPADPKAKEIIYDSPTKFLMGICVTSIVLSGILIFSFIKPSFVEE